MGSGQARLVTVSASYGAGGSVIAPALARRLGVPFLQRATTSTGSTSDQCYERLEPEEAALTPAHRLLASLAGAAPLGSTQSPLPARHHDDDLRQQCEAGIRLLAADRAGVILGRGAAAVLGRGRGYHVRLDGPPALRAAQGAAIEGVSVDEARRRMTVADRARDAYVRRLYRADPAAAGLYHLVIDSTAVPLDTVTELIALALASFPGSGQATAPGQRPGATSPAP